MFAVGVSNRTEHSGGTAMTAPGQEQAVRAMLHCGHRAEYQPNERGYVCVCGETFGKRLDSRGLAYTHEATEMLAALIEPTTETCPKCGGAGGKVGGYTNSARVGGSVAEPVLTDWCCPSCNGAGTVPGPPLAYLAVDLEQVGWAFSAVDKPQRCHPWAFSDLRFDDVGEAVYRVVTSEEEER